MPKHDGRHFPDLTQTHKATVGTAAVYHFRWVKEFSSWAIFTVNDATGEFGIQSDWGSWAHRWNIDALGGGKTLTEFLAGRASADYITDKLSYGEPRSFRQEVDHEATIKTWKVKVLNARMLHCQSRGWLAKQLGIEVDHFADSIEVDEAAEIWDDLKRFARNYDLSASEAEATVAIGDMFTSYDALYEFLGGDEFSIWESIETRPSWGYTFLRECLLPFFFNYLREHILNSQGSHCLECGPDVRVDEDGCCASCGRDSMWFKGGECRCDDFDDGPCPQCLHSGKGKVAANG